MDPRFLLLLACFFLSGFAALLYQTAWTRELSFVFGTSELAVAAVLAAYMGGLALGAAAAGRFAARIRRPVLVYGVLELAIAGSALAVPLFIAAINAGYVALLGGRPDLPEGGADGATLFQLGAAFAVLLPPTAFMGATLPLLARHSVTSDAQIGSRVGVLYAVNTVGAIAGTLVAAFWLMPELGLRRTVWCGASLNAVVFALAVLLARSAPVAPAAERPHPSRAAPSPAPRAGRWILPAMALSGAVSFAYEVLWTRLLGHLLGGSVDAFATMLASFLTGIALGSAVAARLATSRTRAAAGFALSQLGIAVTAYAAFALADKLPSLAGALGAGPGAPLPSACVAGAALLPITLCIGATFPFAVRVLARDPDDAAGATAHVYAWNTVGAIAGALGAGFTLLPTLGFDGTVDLGVAVNLALCAAAGLASSPRRVPLAATAAALGIALVAVPARAPWLLLGSSPLSSRAPRGEREYAGVGRSSTVLVLDQGQGFRLYSNGLPEAVIQRAGQLPQAKLASWLGQVPGILRPDARELLVIGLGGGTVLESVPPTIRSIDVIELEEEVVVANERIADERAVDPLSDPRVRIHVGDARGLLQLTSKPFDAIVSQPSHPWTAGASHLYTREFFEMVRERLAPGGVFVQWIGLGFVDESLLRTLMATLRGVFEHVEVYQPGGGQGLVFAASAAPIASLENARRAIEIAPEAHGRFGIHRVEDVAALRVLDDAGVRAFSAGVAQNTDDYNLLATRASRLGDAALDAKTARRLFSDLDPLLRGTDDLDRSALLRRLATGGFRERASALASTQRGAREELELGWIELELVRPHRAAAHFERALELEPGATEAVVGLVASRARSITRERLVAELGDAEPAAPILAVFDARARAELADWDAVAALDAELGRIEPGHALFQEATALRARWRIAAGGAERAAEAQALLETMLSRQWSPVDALLHARAAIAAGAPRAAWGSLGRVADVLRRSSRSGELRAEAFEIAGTLPSDLAADVLDELRAGSRGG